MESVVDPSGEVVPYDFYFSTSLFLSYEYNVILLLVAYTFCSPPSRDVWLSLMNAYRYDEASDSKSSIYFR